MSLYIDVTTLERYERTTNPSIVPLTDFINKLDLEIWDENVKHMRDCADGLYGHEGAMVNFAKEWLQRADEIGPLLAGRQIPVVNPRGAAAADADA